METRFRTTCAVHIPGMEAKLARFEIERKENVSE